MAKNIVRVSLLEFEHIHNSFFNIGISYSLITYLICGEKVFCFAVVVFCGKVGGSNFPAGSISVHTTSED